MTVGRFLVKVLRKFLVSFALVVIHPLLLMGWLYLEELLIPGENIDVVGLGFISTYIAISTAYVTAIVSFIAESVWELRQFSFSYVYVLIHVITGAICIFVIMPDWKWVILGAMFGLFYGLVDILLIKAHTKIIEKKSNDH